MAIEGADLLETMGDASPGVRAFLAEPTGNAFLFHEIIPADGNGWWSFTARASDAFPPASSVTAGARAHALTAITRERRRTLDGFRLACWGLAVATVVLLGLDAAGLFEVTPTRLTLIAVVIALVVVPFAGKLKVLGVEFERLRHAEDDAEPERARA